MDEPSPDAWWTHPPTGPAVVLPPPQRPHPGPPPASPPGRAGRRRAALGVAALAVVAVLGAAALSTVGDQPRPAAGGVPPQQPAPRTTVGAGPSAADETAPAPLQLPDQTPAARRGDFPPAGVEEQPGRLLPPVDPGVSGTYAFMNVAQDGQPARFSPCRPLHIVVNVEDAPPGGYDAVVQAAAAVEAATGLRLIIDGETDETVDLERRPFQPERYGDRWAPVLVGWLPETGERVAGHGGPSSVTLLGTGAEYNVSGVVSLDSADEANTDPNIMRLVAMHELSHVVGLGHSSDPSELMAPVLDGQTGFGPGDLAALAIAGAGPCTEDV